MCVFWAAAAFALGKVIEALMDGACCASQLPIRQRGVVLALQQEVNSGPTICVCLCTLLSSLPRTATNFRYRTGEGVCVPEHFRFGARSG